MLLLQYIKVYIKLIIEYYRISQIISLEMFLILVYIIQKEKKIDLRKLEIARNLTKFKAGCAYFFTNLSLGACLAMCLFFHQSEPGCAYKFGAYKEKECNGTRMD